MQRQVQTNRIAGCADSIPATYWRKRSLWCATALAGSLSLTVVSAAHALPSGGPVSPGSITSAQGVFAGVPSSQIAINALPAGGSVSAGSASIISAPGALTINQSSQNVAINWSSF